MIVLAKSAHPHPRPFCAGMLAAGTRGSKEAGQAVTVVDLHALRAAPTSGEGLREGRSPARLRQEAE